jgi:hypothetical protein
MRKLIREQINVTHLLLLNKTVEELRMKDSFVKEPHKKDVLNQNFFSKDYKNSFSKSDIAV